MLLDMESLRCFDAVAAALSFRRAAGRLALSPAALSDRIRRLEEALGEALLLRTTRRVALTPAGTRLLPRVRELLAANERLAGLAREGREEPAVELLVGTRYELGLSWLVPGLPRLEGWAPGRTLHLRFSEGSDLLEQVGRGLLDCAVTSAPLVGGALDYLVLHPETYVLVGAAELLRCHPLAEPAGALAHTLLDLSPDLPLFRYFLDQAGGSTPWRFGRSEYLGTIGAVRLRLLQGRGVAVLPRYFVAADLRAGLLRRALGQVRLRTDHFRLVWRRDHPRAQAIQALGVDLKRLPLR